MISTHDKTDQQIQVIGLDLLQKELGAIRFLQQFERGHGNYTQERQMQADTDTVDDLVGQIMQRRLQKSSVFYCLLKRITSLNSANPVVRPYLAS